MSNRFEMPLAPLLLALNVLAIACGGGDSTQPPPGGVLAVSKPAAGSGDAQTGTVGQPLASPIQVLVTEDGSAAAGVTVTWSAVPSTAGTMTPPSGPTNADGLASSTWLLGTVSGAHSARATVTGASGSPVTFSATAAPDVARTLSRGDGDGQSGVINTQLAAPVQAEVTDQFGNGVPGVAVGWAATGATVSAATVPTNATGISAVNVTLGGTEGSITITATSGSLTGSPLTFSAAANAPAPTPTSIDVSVRNDNFLSFRNGTSNPAVDTVLAGGTVTWTWAAAATNPHDVTSTGSPSFPGRATAIQPPPYTFTFSTPGTYNYYCTLHGLPASGMRGRIVVQ